VQFTDTSTGSPTSWAWDFGDGTTSTDRNPQHTFAAGTHTVTLRATNGAGQSPAVSATITVTEPVPPAATVEAGASTSAASTVAVTDVVLGRPAGVDSGDLLIAEIVADLSPSVSVVPDGWTLLMPRQAIGTKARTFVYYKVVGAIGAEPTTYTWRLNNAVKWGAGMTAFSGVDVAAPFEPTVSGVIDSTSGASTLAVPGVTVAVAGSVVVGGVGIDTSSTSVNPPAGWSTDWESTGGQVGEVAHLVPGAPGATGDVVWSFGKAVASAGWMAVIRPAPGG
jgi:PKD repeat protein